MATSRVKTIKIARLVRLANNGLENTSVVDKQWRLGVISLLETALAETKNPSDYEFLPSEYDSEGNLKPDFDPTRRRYF